MALLIKCNHCLVEVSQLDRFCRQCGQALTAATVILADLPVQNFESDKEEATAVLRVDYTNYSLQEPRSQTSAMSGGAPGSFFPAQACLPENDELVCAERSSGQEELAAKDEPWYISSEFGSLAPMQESAEEKDIQASQLSVNELREGTGAEGDVKQKAEGQAYAYPNIDFSCAQPAAEKSCEAAFFGPEDQWLSMNSFGQPILLSEADRTTTNIQVYQADQVGFDEEVDFRRASVFGQKSDLFALRPSLDVSATEELKRFANSTDLGSLVEQVSLHDVRTAIEQHALNSASMLSASPERTSPAEQTEAVPGSGNTPVAPEQTEVISGSSSTPVALEQTAAGQKKPSSIQVSGMLGQRVEIDEDQAAEMSSLCCTSRSELPEFLMKAAARSSSQTSPAVSAALPDATPAASSEPLVMPPKPSVDRQRYLSPNLGSRRTTSNSETTPSKFERSPRLHSPILSKPSSSQDFDSLDYEEERSISSEYLLGMPRKLVAIAAVAVLFLGIVGGAWMFFEEKQRQDLKMQALECTRLMDAARIAFDGGRYEDALKQMERLSSYRKGKMMKDELSLMDDVRFVVGKMRYDNGDFEQARSFLSAISSSSEKYTMAQPMLLALSTSVPESSSGSQDNARKEGVSAATETLIGDQEQHSIADVARSTFGVAPTQEAPRKRLAYKPSEEKSLSLPKLEKIKEEPSSVDSGWNEYAENQQSPPASKVAGEEQQAEKFSEADVTKYNAMLEKHFSNPDNQSSDSTKSGTEPPTFEQWLKDGKTDF